MDMKVAAGSISVAIALVLVAGCAAPVGGGATDEATPTATESVATAVPTSTSTSQLASAPTTTAADPDPSRARASKALEQSLDALPVFPGAQEADATGAEPGFLPQVDGWFFVARRWHVDAKPAAVVHWYRSRLKIIGGMTGSTKGIPMPQTLMVGGPVAPDPSAVASAQVLVAVDTDGQGSSVTATAGGAPIPVRTDASRIPAADVHAATIDITPACSPEPAGAGPSHPKQVQLGPADRERLIALLDTARVQPGFESGGLACGYDVRITFRGSADTSWVVDYDSSHPMFGAVLQFGPRDQRLLVPDQQFFTILKRVTGVRLP